jgi:hypothetical protein
MTLEIHVHGCRQAEKCGSVKPFYGTPAPILLIIVSRGNTDIKHDRKPTQVRLHSAL